MFNPSFLRDVGVGVWNGSLWTISVEIQFYCLMPLVAWLCYRTSANSRLVRTTVVLVCSAIVSVVLQNTGLIAGETMGQKLLRYSSLPYFHMFAGGVLAREVFSRFPSLFRGKALHWAMCFIATASCCQMAGMTIGSNLPNPAAFIALSGLILAVGYTSTNLSNQILRGNDISYGVYLYHMPIVNAILFLELNESATAVWAVFALAALLGTISWFTIERPAIRPIVGDILN